MDLLHEINESRFNEYFEFDQMDESRIGVFDSDNPDEPVFVIFQENPKKISAIRPEEDWAGWAFSCFLNDMAVRWNGSVTGKNKFKAEERNFTNFHDFIAEMTKIHSTEHYNWLETQIPSRFESIALPSGRLEELLADLV
jgi:hypothetical protein